MNTENFEKHVIFDKLDQFKKTIMGLKSIAEIDLNQLTFFQSVFDYISQRVNLTIPDLVQEAELNTLTSQIDAGVVQINNFLGNSNSGHLTNATNNFYSALAQIRNFPIPLSKNDFNFSKKIANFENTVKKKYKIIENEKESLAQEFSDFSIELINNQNQIDDLNDLISKKEASIEALNENFQNEYLNIKTRHNNSFEIDQKNYRNEIDEIKEKFRTEIDDVRSSIDTDTSKLVTSLNKKLVQAKTIVNVIGNVGVTGNYQNIANEHKSSANFWRWVAIALMGTLSGLLVYVLFDMSSSSFDWTKSLLRIIAVAALSYPASYAAKESSKHRKLENLNRTAELELASVDAFIEMLSEDKKQDIKEKLVDKYFGNDKSDILGNDKDNEGLSIGGLEKIISALLKLKK